MQMLVLQITEHTLVGSDGVTDSVTDSDGLKD